MSVNKHIYYFSSMKPIQSTCLILFVFFMLGLRAQSNHQEKADSISRLPGDSVKVEAWIGLSNAYKSTNYPASEMYADSAIQLALRLNILGRLAHAYNLHGRAAMNQSKYDLAESSYKSALNYYDSVGNASKKALLLNNLSVVKRDQALFDESMDYLFQSLAICERIEDTTGIANAFTNIAVVYAIKQEYDRAEEYFLKALDIWRIKGHERNVNTILLNLGGILVESAKYDGAIEYLAEARTYFEEHGPQTELGRAHYILGNIYLLTDELDKSEGNYLIAKGIFDDIGQQMRATGCLLRLSSVAEKRGNVDKAINYATEAYNRNIDMGVGNMAIRSLTQLSNLYEQKGDYKTALSYYKQLTQIRDSISDMEREKQITELEAKYQNEVKERQLAAAQSELEVKDLRNRRQEVQKRILIGIVIGIALFLLLLFYQFRTKSQINRVLEDKNALIEKSLGEKEVLLKEIHHRVKNNLQFISSLFNLQARHVKDEEALKILQEGKNRIQSMALVHQKLYQEENLKGVDMAQYLANLMDSLKHSYKATSDKVKVKTTVDTISLDIDTAMPIGLIVNELVTNAFKYAFNEVDKGSLAVSLVAADNQLELTVRDSGVGLPDDLDAKNPKKFGLRLVRSLAEKLGSEPIVESKNGLTVRIAITNYKTNEV
jgi:two-component sensor histidine kinase/cbb3-type cytochrome oxidase subunit 3